MARIARLRLRGQAAEAGGGRADADELFSTTAIRGYSAAGLAEYRREGTLAFNRMRAAVDRDIVRTLFHFQVERPNDTAPG